MTVHTLFRPNGNLLMSLTQTVTVSTATKQIEVSLKRSEAKITLTCKQLPDSLLSLEHIVLVMCRDRPSLRNMQKEPIRLLHGMLTGWTKKSYWVSEYFQFEGDADNITTSFYMPENRNDREEGYFSGFPRL